MVCRGLWDAGGHWQVGRVHKGLWDTAGQGGVGLGAPEYYGTLGILMCLVGGWGRFAGGCGMLGLTIGPGGGASGDYVPVGVPVGWGTLQRIMGCWGDWGVNLGIMGLWD